jgi:hypothetical protein
MMFTFYHLVEFISSRNRHCLGLPVPATALFQEPTGFSIEEEEEDVPPVCVPHEGGKKRKGSKSGKSKKGKGKKAKTTSSPEPASSSSPVATRAAVLNTFPEAYKAVIQSLPTCLWPTSAKHGQHSYTVYLGNQHTCCIAE